MSAAVGRADAVLEARGVTLALGGRRVLADASVRCAAGRWIAVVGPNGAGKSTLLKVLAGLAAPGRGRVLLHGRPLAGWPARDRALRLGWMGPEDGAQTGLRVADVVMLGRLPHRPWFTAASAADRQAVQAAMARAGCADWAARGLDELSSGERQRVQLARLLAVEAPVMLMDEPLANLDPPHQADWVALARDLAARGGTVVSVLHELDAALQADELLVLRGGAVLHQGPVGCEAARAALVQAFDGRIRLLRVDNRWIALF